MKFQKTLLTVLLIAASFLALAEPAKPEKKQKNEDLVFREPFTLKLHIDKEHYFQEKITQKIPYVYAKQVYLFVGENFGINFVVKDDEISDIKYQKDLKKADMTFKFTQSKLNNGKSMMMLVIKNKSKKTVYLKGVMAVPGKEGLYRTSILPVKAGLTNFESWPHPIIQLLLEDFSFKKPSPARKKAKTPKQGK